MGAHNNLSAKKKEREARKAEKRIEKLRARRERKDEATAKAGSS